MCRAMVNDMGMWGPGWMAAAGLLFVLLAGVVVAAAMVAAAGWRRPSVVWGSSLGESRAVAVAKERYARGDIDHAELERILDTVLRGEEHPRGRPW